MPGTTGRSPSILGMTPSFDSQLRKPDSPVKRDWRSEVDATIEEAKQLSPGGRRSSTPLKRIVRKDELDRWRTRLTSFADSSTTLLYSPNADLLVLLHQHRTGRGMDAWVIDGPHGGGLQLQLLITVGWPQLPGKDPSAQARMWARQNVYVCKITLPDGTVQERRFDVEGNQEPQPNNVADRPMWVSMSPIFAVDSERWGGNTIRIEGWPEGSAKTAGYVERRLTNLWI